MGDHLTSVLLEIVRTPLVKTYGFRANISKLIGLTSLNQKWNLLATPKLVITANTKVYGTHNRYNSYIRWFSRSLPSSIFLVTLYDIIHFIVNVWMLFKSNLVTFKTLFYIL